MSGPEAVEAAGISRSTYIRARGKLKAEGKIACRKAEFKGGWVWVRTGPHEDSHPEATNPVDSRRFSSLNDEHLRENGHEPAFAAQAVDVFVAGCQYPQHRASDWISKDGARRCGVCAPPATEAVLREWVGAKT